MKKPVRDGGSLWGLLSGPLSAALQGQKTRPSLFAGLVLCAFIVGPIWYTFLSVAHHIARDCVAPRGLRGGLPPELWGMVNTDLIGATLMGGDAKAHAEANGSLPDFELFECDRSSDLTDYCVIQGDVRVDYSTGEIVLVARRPETPRGLLRVQPYPRKWDDPVMDTITTQEIYSVDPGSAGVFEEENHDLDHLKSLRGSGKGQDARKKAPRFRRKGSALQCTKHSEAPAVLFSAGGYSGGIFHDFNEVFVPLFQTTQALKKEVVLMVADLKGKWWFRGSPKESFAGAFTKYPIRLMNSATDAEGTSQEVECFPKLIIGLKHNLCLYDEYSGKKERDEVKAGVRFRDFSLRVMESMELPEWMWDPNNNEVFLPKGKQPHLCMVQRQKTRRITNYDRLRELAINEGFGVFDIVFEELTPHQIVEFMRYCDGLIGVHGAGFTNTVFMRPRSVILQIMPFGEYGEGMVVGREYKNIAEALAASYMEWHVPREYSSLWTQFNETSVELADPRSLWMDDLIKAMTLYHSQDVTVPEKVFKTLLRHMTHALALQEGITGEYIKRQVEVKRAEAAQTATHGSQ